MANNENIIVEVDIAEECSKRVCAEEESEFELEEFEIEE